MPPKQRRTRRKITHPTKITPTSASQPQEQQTGSVSNEHNERYGTTRELPSLEEPLETETTAATTTTDEPVKEKEPVGNNKPSSIDETVNKQTVEEEESSVKDSTIEEPSVEESSAEEHSVEEPFVDNPLLEGPSFYSNQQVYIWVVHVVARAQPLF